jgi:uncharacterized protein with HEPN domain
MNPDSVRILKMEGHADILINYVAECGSYDTYAANEPVCSASALHLLQIGELANGLSDSFQYRHKDISWKSIVGLRNIIAHRYGDLDYNRIWEIMVKEIPELVHWLKSVKDCGYMTL